MDSEVKDLDADGESDTPSVSTGRDHLEMFSDAKFCRSLMEGLSLCCEG